MDFLDILHCKRCQDLFNVSSRRPMILACGHTFCEFCMRELFDAEKVLCPIDKIDSYFDDFAKISVNYLILDALEARKQLKNEEKTCQIHKTQVIRFFCQTHMSLLCQECLILHHLGPDHHILPSDNIVLISPLKQSLSRLLDRLKSSQDRLSQRQKDSNEEFLKSSNELKSMRKSLEDLIERNYTELIQRKTKEIEAEMQKISKFNEKIEKIEAETGKIEAFLLKIPAEMAYITDSEPEMLQEMKRYEAFLLENQDLAVSVPNIKPAMAFMEPPLLCKEAMEQIIRTQIPTYDKKNRKMLNNLKEEGVLKSDLIFHTMMLVNRRNYVPENLINRAYQDNPLAIGWNTTISAPHMHANTLEELKGHLRKGGRAIDIGCGSGYITACMAEIMGENSKVFGIDHIEDIVSFARGNVQKKNSYLLDSKRVEFVRADGRKGYADGGPYDVIHVGGAIPQVPQEMLDQLAKGGRMWIPLGPSGCQAIYVYDKDQTGNVKSQKLFSVSYGPLTSMESQMQNY